MRLSVLAFKIKSSNDDVKDNDFNESHVTAINTSNYNQMGSCVYPNLGDRCPPKTLRSLDNCLVIAVIPVHKDHNDKGEKCYKKE